MKFKRFFAVLKDGPPEQVMPRQAQEKKFLLVKE